MSFVPPPRESFLQVDAQHQRVKEAQARMRDHSKVHYDGEEDSGTASRPQGLLARLMDRLRGHR